MRACSAFAAFRVAFFHRLSVFGPPREDFNEVVKRLLGEGVAYDAILVGSYAYWYRRYWQNLIPGPLLHEMVEKRFLMRSIDQQVLDVLEPGRFAQTCQQNRSPRPHTVNVPGWPLKAFATFVTVADERMLSPQGDNCSFSPTEGSLRQ
jgi:hypothetical protein